MRVDRLSDSAVVANCEVCAREFPEMAPMAALIRRLSVKSYSESLAAST